jgi:hypothetical protein
MYQQNIPCASQVSTSALVGSGVSGLGAFRTPTGPPTVTSVSPNSGTRFPRPVRRGVGNYMQQSGALSTSNLFASGRGLGCRCNGLGDGLTMDGTGLFGTGLFSGGLDVSNWTMWEYGTLGIGAYLLFSIFHTTKTVARATRRKVRAVARA